MYGHFILTIQWLKFHAEEHCSPEFSVFENKFTSTMKIYEKYNIIMKI